METDTICEYSDRDNPGLDSGLVKRRIHHILVSIMAESHYFYNRRATTCGKRKPVKLPERQNFKWSKFCLSGREVLDIIHRKLRLCLVCGYENQTFQVLCVNY